MAKMKVYEIAKEVNKRSKEVIDFLNKSGVEITSHMSNVDEKAISLIRKEFTKPQKTEKTTENKEVKTNVKKVNTSKARTSRDNRTSRAGKDSRPPRDNNASRPSRPTKDGNRQQGQTGQAGQTQRPRQNNNQQIQGRRKQNIKTNNQQTGDNKNPRNNRNTTARKDTNRKDFISNKLEKMDNNAKNVGKKTTNAAMVTSRSESTNRRNKDKRKRQNYNTDKSKDESNKKVLKKGQFIKPKVEKKIVEKVTLIEVPEVITLKELAKKMRIDSSNIIKKLFLKGKVVTINEEITYEEAEEIAIEYDILVEKEKIIDEVEEILKEEDDDPSTLEKRPPVVCVMGHVDHGKTSLLDAIRETRVTTGEAGGITQHIGAYVVESEGEKVTFLDTPGHEAFTSMRMRGAQSTDIAILVVAADDGVMPQTVEAINHAKAAEIQIIVAVNKIDKPSANIERVKQELVEYELVAEDWGGDTVIVPVSAHTGEGIDTLLEMVLLTAELLELKANPDRNARGLVVEAELDKGRGPVATVLVQKGTLHVGDAICIGTSCGRVRAMLNDKGERVEEAIPSTPVEILGLDEVPEAGEMFVVSDTEKESRNIALTYLAQNKERLIANTKSKLSLDGLFSQIQAGNLKELNIIVKADVQGSVEAVKQSLEKLSNDEVAVRVIHGGVGAINESDVTLASASNAVIIGFNVRPDSNAKETAITNEVDLRLYRVIYNAIEDVENAMKGMLDPTFEEKVIGQVEVRDIFKASGVGNIAGSYVTEGRITKSSQVRIVRNGIVIYDGTLASLKRFKDDAKEVKAGFECGLVFEKYNDIKVGDIVEAYIMEEIPRE